jgi:hypothetical protein
MEATMGRLIDAPPCWMIARFPGTCLCGRKIVAGSTIYYKPWAKRALCRSCGVKDEEYLDSKKLPTAATREVRHG